MKIRRRGIRFRKSIELVPKQLDAYADLAWLLRERLSLPQEADEYMRKMVQQNSKSDKAHLAYARYLLGKVGRIADPNQATEQAKLATAEAQQRCGWRRTIATAFSWPPSPS